MKTLVKAHISGTFCTLVIPFALLLMSQSGCKPSHSQGEPSTNEWSIISQPKPGEEGPVVANDGKGNITKYEYNGFKGLKKTTYPNNTFAAGLRQIAELIRAGIGLRVACLDLPGYSRSKTTWGRRVAGAPGAMELTSSTTRKTS